MFAFYRRFDWTLPGTELTNQISVFLTPLFERTFEQNLPHTNGTVNYFFEPASHTVYVLFVIPEKPHKKSRDPVNG